MTTKTWPEPPKPKHDEGVIDGCFGPPTCVDEPRQTPMHTRGRAGAPPGWESPRYDDGTACKHGKASCEECGTTTRRDARHTTKGGLGAVGQLRKRR